MAIYLREGKVIPRVRNMVMQSKDMITSGGSLNSVSKVPVEPNNSTFGMTNTGQVSHNTGSFLGSSVNNISFNKIKRKSNIKFVL
jgi:hypothetical protein